MHLPGPAGSSSCPVQTELAQRFSMLHSQARQAGHLTHVLPGLALDCTQLMLCTQRRAGRQSGCGQGLWALVQLVSSLRRRAVPQCSH